MMTPGQINNKLAGKAEAEAAFRARVEEIGFRAAYREVLISPTFLLALDAIVEAEEAEASAEAARDAEEESDGYLEPLNQVRIAEIADLLDMDAAEVAAFCHADWGDPHHRAWLHTSTNKQIATWILACTYTM